MAWVQILGWFEHVRFILVNFLLRLVFVAYFFPISPGAYNIFPLQQVPGSSCFLLAKVSAEHVSIFSQKIPLPVA